MVDLPQFSMDPERDRQMCFGCGPQNPIGLKLKFEPNGNGVKAEFMPAEVHQGWTGIAHGGIVHTLLDEAMSWSAAFAGVITVTATMQVRWKRPAKIGETLVLNAWVTRNSKRLLETAASVTLKDGTIVAEGNATMYVIGRSYGNDKQ
jgi:uncharacterized protein (TIGR00369 family)